MAAASIVAGGAAAPSHARLQHSLGTNSYAAPDSCDSVFVWSRVGWTDQPYEASLRQWDDGTQFPRAHLILTLNEVAARLRFDTPVQLSHLGANTLREQSESARHVVTFDVQGMYSFAYERSGRLSSIRVLVSSLSPTIDSALVRAVREASDIGTLTPLPETSKSDAVELRLTVGSSVIVDSLAVKGPVFRLRQPILRDPHPPTMDKKTHVSARYPDHERRSGIEGSVFIQFVVRADGTVDPDNILIPKATTMSFASNVYDAVLKSRYVPGSVAGCRVPYLVIQPIDFTIAR
jgi:TonB family protein